VASATAARHNAAMTPMLALSAPSWRLRRLDGNWQNALTIFVKLPTIKLTFESA
jgi:hypothetical protein